MNILKWTMVGGLFCAGLAGLIGAQGIGRHSEDDQLTDRSQRGAGSHARRGSAIANAPRSPGEKGGTNETGPYEVIPDFFHPQFPEGWTWGQVSGVFAETPNRIYVTTRGMLPVLPFFVGQNGRGPARERSAQRIFLDRL
jgi:hypothetical protein